MTEAERYATTTPFLVIYNSFFSKITDDMYLGLSKADTYEDAKNILLVAITRFEFPKFKLYDYDPDAEVLIGTVKYQGQFNFGLEVEEIEILAHNMLLEWISRQITTIDITRMKYSSSDFKLTSQANHLAKLLEMQKEYAAENKKKQRLYGRRKIDENGYIKPNYGGLGGGVYGN